MTSEAVKEETIYLNEDMEVVSKKNANLKIVTEYDKNGMRVSSIYSAI